MRVQDVMTANPTCCTEQASLKEAARMMAQSDCGEIPVVDAQRRPTGVITDRDIACRAVAEGKDPQSTSVREVMSSPVVTVTPETDLDEVCEQMEAHQIRRIPVVDENGIVCGMVSQADIARTAPPRDTAEVVREISRPAGQAARI